MIGAQMSFLSSLLQTSASTIAAIFGAMAVIALIELAIPLHARRAENRTHIGPNMALTFMTFATNVVINGALMLVLLKLDEAGFGILRWTGLDARIADVTAVVALDFSFYAAHVAMHKVPALWRVHRVHHSD